MFLRKPKEIQEEWITLHDAILEVKATCQETVDRLEHRKRLLDAELLLATEYNSANI